MPGGGGGVPPAVMPHVSPTTGGDQVSGKIVGRGQSSAGKAAGEGPIEKVSECRVHATGYV